MCRNIKPLFNFEPAVTDDEIDAASLQYVRKISGFTVPSDMNSQAFYMAVKEVSRASKKLVLSLVTSAKPKDRDVEIEKARIRVSKRFNN